MLPNITRSTYRWAAVEWQLFHIVHWKRIRQDAAQVSREAMERVWRPTIRDDHGSATQKSESAHGVSLNPSKLEGTSILINFKSEVVLSPEKKEHVSFYPAVGKISIGCMKPEEIFAEKIRALLTRLKARDIFDIYFLIQRDVWASRELIQTKLNYYQEVFSIPKILERISVFEAIWNKEISGLTKDTLSFEFVSAHIKKKMKERYA